MPSALPPLGSATSIGEVIANIERVIAWSLTADSRLGYFAALYKRITIAIRNGIDDHLFDDGPRMERFDVTFANRYFAALDAYFHPADFPAVSHCWRVAFDGSLLPQPVIVQHLLAGVNAHIDLDLGIAAEAVAPGAELEALHHDFNLVNAVLASQVSTVITEIDELSPVLAEIYSLLMKRELDLIADGLVVVRDAAWDFAKILADEPALLHPSTVMLQDLAVARVGGLVLHPPGLLERIVEVIGASESRDIVKNIETLDAIAASPAPMTAAAASRV